MSANRQPVIKVPKRTGMLKCRSTSVVLQLHLQACK